MADFRFMSYVTTWSLFDLLGPECAGWNWTVGAELRPSWE